MLSVLIIVLSHLIHIEILLSKYCYSHFQMRKLRHSNIKWLALQLWCGTGAWAVKMDTRAPTSNHILFAQAVYIYLYVGLFLENKLGEMILNGS